MLAAEAGVLVASEGTEATIESVIVSSCKSSCAVIVEGATATLKSCFFKGSKEGHGIMVYGKGTQVQGDAVSYTHLTLPTTPYV